MSKKSSAMNKGYDKVKSTKPSMIQNFKRFKMHPDRRAAIESFIRRFQRISNSKGFIEILNKKAPDNIQNKL